jgi:DNA-binding NtrC family response regulator
MRLGGTRERDIDMRLVAATHRDLEVDVRAGRFREDLFFRINTATVWLPPLRDRPMELLVLCEAFIDDACRRAGRPTMSLAPACAPVLASYAWPGNVRELRNAIEYAVAAAEPEATLLVPSQLPERLRRGVPSAEPAERAGRTERAPAPGGSVAFRPIDEEVRDLERRRMRAALAAAGGNQTEAAKLIGMPRRTFIRKLSQYGLREDGGEGDGGDE